MPEQSIRDRCQIDTNKDGDSFVGIRGVNGSFSIHFPLGFHISESDKDLRKDILLLLNVLSSANDKKESVLQKQTKGFTDQGFPLQAYLFVISDYYAHGYYREREIQYQTSTRGKIDWSRTVKQQKPYIQGTEAYYLKFTTKRNPINENELITLIHEYCVFESFNKVGWLFTAALPKQPRIKYNPKLFKYVVREKLSHTFNDRNKALFINMLAIIDELQDPSTGSNFQYGIDSFDHIWEVLIDEVYGIKGKKAYYPKTTWKLSGENSENDDLRPDSIMLWNGNVYVLDAKNYQFGATRSASDLPKSTDINKQITYGEYVAEQEKFKKIHGLNFVTYNAFLMPFDSVVWSNPEAIRWIGEAESNWKSGDKIYERVQGVLIDVKFLMNAYFEHDDSVIMQLAELIADAVEKKANG